MTEGPSAREVLSDRSVRCFLAATTLSTTAVVGQAVALGVRVFDLTGRELDLGVLGLVEFLPSMLLVTVAGGVADRADRRKIARAMLVVESLAAAGLALLAGRDGGSLASILGVVLVFGTARAFANPALRALPANIVDRERLPRLSALYSLSWQLALIAGPVLGGLAYAIDPRLPFAGAALGLASAAGLLGLVRATQQLAGADGDRGTSRLRQALEGLRVIRGNQILLGAITLDLFAVLFGGAVALLPALAQKRLGIGPVGLGWLRAAGGIGAASMAAILAVRPVRARVGRALFAAVGIFGAATIVLGITRSAPVAFVAILVLSAADAVSVFIRVTLTPLVVPDELRGRVLAVEAVFIGASNELGAFESGVAGQLLGPALAVSLGGVATLVVVGVAALAFPALGRVDRFSDLTER